MVVMAAGLGGWSALAFGLWLLLATVLQAVRRGHHHGSPRESGKDWAEEDGTVILVWEPLLQRVGELGFLRDCCNWNVPQLNSGFLLVLPHPGFLVVLSPNFRLSWIQSVRHMVKEKRNTKVCRDEGFFKKQAKMQETDSLWQAPSLRGKPSRLWPGVHFLFTSSSQLLVVSVSHS